jgi:hypothetical protein
LLGRGGIHRLLAAVDVANDAYRVDYESGPFGDAQKAEHAVFTGDCLVRIAEQRECKAQLLGEAAVRLRPVDADPQNLGAHLFETGKTILVCLEFLRSTRRVGIDKESQDDATLPTEIAEPDEPAIVVQQHKFRCYVSDVQCHRGIP